MTASGVAGPSARGTPPSVRIHRSPRRALASFNTDRLRWLDEAAARGGVAALAFGPLRTWVVTDPGVARAVLASGVWSRPLSERAPIRIGVGDSLITYRGRRWQRSQRPAATAARRQALGPLTELSAIIDAEVDAVPLGQVVDVDHIAGMIAFRSAVWLLFGQLLERDRAADLLASQRAVTEWIGDRFGRPTNVLPPVPGTPSARRLHRHRETLRAFAGELLDHSADGMLGALTGDHRARVGQLLGLLLAANETTAAALMWAVVHGARHVDAWARVAASGATADDLNHFVEETLRLSPPVWGIARAPRWRAELGDASTGVTRVARHEMVMVYVRGLNRRPDLWANASRFDPGRFASTEARPPILSFGFGPRGCIGQRLAMLEVTQAVAALARRGRVELASDPVEQAHFSLRSAQPVRASWTAQPASIRGS